VTDDRTWVPVPLARGSRGAVVAPHHLATAAGLGILRAGGSAIDAAIATNAVLGVVMPESCGIGGDAFWLVWDATTHQQVALNGSGRAAGGLAAAGLDAATLRAAGRDVLPDRGPLTITVPGAVRSWAHAHERWGRLDRAAVLAPAIELARDGFAAWDGFVNAVEDGTAELAGSLERASGEAFARMFRPHGRPWRPGERVRFRALATTLETLARDGFDALYEGDLAERQARALAAAGSPIRLEDFSAQDATWETPIGTTYRGVRVTVPPPNSSGVVALQQLRVLERFDPPPQAAFGPAGVADARWIHLGIEAAKLAVADRDRHLADPAAAPVPVDELLDDSYVAGLAARIDPGRSSRPPGGPYPTRGDTVYVAAVDAEGTAVSLLQSNYADFGSGIVDPATGVHFHNRGTYFSLRPGHPNELAPGKRPLHTLLPGMLFRDDAAGPWIVVGSMGGDAQPQIHAQFVSAVIDGGLDIRTAVAAPRWFVAPARRFDPPIDLRIEPRMAPGVAEALEALGHPVMRGEPFDPDLGHQHAIELVEGGPGSDGGSLAATTDPRSAGLPATW
jgi:gamma-glutamyltranspeptidase/glutathione hydrolase